MVLRENNAIMETQLRFRNREREKGKGEGGERRGTGLKDKR